MGKFEALSGFGIREKRLDVNVMKTRWVMVVMIVVTLAVIVAKTWYHKSGIGVAGIAFM
jgi:hypothetical protein